MKRRTKIAIMATALLVSVALIGVGFASWVIASQNQQTVAGNIQAEAVSGNFVYLEVTRTAGENIIFGTPDSTGNTTGWLTYGEGSKAEALTATFTVTVSGNAKNIEITLDSEKFWEAFGKGYVAAPEVSIGGTSADMYTLSESNKTLSEEGNVTLTRNTSSSGTYDAGTNYEFTVTVTFDWGSKFGNKNPYEYYNNDDTHKAGSYESKKAANTNLNGLYTLLGEGDGVTYTFTFTEASANA